MTLDGIFFGSEDLHLYAVERSSGLVRWRFELKGEVRAFTAMVSSPVVANGLVIFGAGDQNVYSIDERTGEERWRFRTRWVVNSSPSVAGSRVYFGSGEGALYVLDLATG